MECAVNLQQRILNAFSHGETLTWGEVHDCVHDIERSALDVGLGALVRAKKLILAGARYSLAKPAHESPAPSGSGGVPVPPPSAEIEAAASLRALEPMPKKVRVKVSAPVPRPPEDSDASTHPVIGDRVLEHVKAKRQASLNRIEVLKVDLVNEERLIIECDEFLRLYQRFAQGAKP